MVDCIEVTNNNETTVNFFLAKVGYPNLRVNYQNLYEGSVEIKNIRTNATIFSIPPGYYLYNQSDLKEGRSQLFVVTDKCKDWYLNVISVYSEDNLKLEKSEKEKEVITWLKRLFLGGELVQTIKDDTIPWEDIKAYINSL
jgi:hypothetical protein